MDCNIRELQSAGRRSGRVFPLAPRIALVFLAGLIGTAVAGERAAALDDAPAPRRSGLTRLSILPFRVPEEGQGKKVLWHFSLGENLWHFSLGKSMALFISTFH